MVKPTISTSWIISGYVLGIIALFLYSFTQIDLSLTLSRASWFQEVQKSFQYIGYFNRPVSTYLFIGIFIFLYLCYLWIITTIRDISRKNLWGVIIFSAVLLSIAYNAFSYDLFNYIFDAKIITYYHLNPYEYKALDFPTDPMLSFMRWTHRTYPYGPVWLGLTVPLSYLAMQYFLVTFFIFKAFMLVCFLATTWYIGKILRITNPGYEKLGVAFFALNPFILVESVLSAHLDIVMLLFITIALYLLVKKKYIFTFIMLLIAYGVKFASASFSFLIHGVTIVGFLGGMIVFTKVQKKASWNVWFIIIGCCMVIPIILASLRTNFQPWYLLILMPFVALGSEKKYITIPMIILSFFALGEYVPYLFFGNWDNPIPLYLLWIRVTGLFVAAGSFVLLYFRRSRKSNHTK